MKDRVSKYSYSLTERVKFLHKVAIICQNKLLVLKRKPNDFARPNAWDLPGGNSTWPQAEEFVENPHLDDVIREVWEETCLKISAQGLDPIAVFSGYVPKKELYTIVVGWRYELKGQIFPKVVLSEHSEFKWLPKKEAIKLDFGKGGEYLRKIIERSFLELSPKVENQ